jgi:murein L,D-transpeptidase YcbB/YkuD
MQRKTAVAAALCALVLSFAQAGWAQSGTNQQAPNTTAPLTDASGLALMLERLAQEKQAWLEAAAAYPDAPSIAHVAVPAKALKRGSQGADVAILCKALEARGFAPCSPGQRVVDAPLAASIATAQRYYGLTADGLADTQLYNALALSATERAARIEALMHEWENIRARARELGADKYLVVNIPAYDVKAVAGDGIRLSSKAVVGRPERQTPVGLMSVRALKFNPDWTPPPTVLKNDIYPNLANGGAWIRDHGLVLIDRAGKQVEWEGLSADAIRSAGYRFVQPASERAALGLLKFETDSAENIYLHDTNERGLFTRAMRAKSSGCIRVERWRELGAWMSDGQLESIDRKVATRKTFFEATPKVPVFVIYQLAELSNGRVVYYPDIYQRGIPEQAAAKALVAQR